MVVLSVQVFERLAFSTHLLNRFFLNGEPLSYLIVCHNLFDLRTEYHVFQVAHCYCRDSETLMHLTV